MLPKGRPDGGDAPGEGDATAKFDSGGVPAVLFRNDAGSPAAGTPVCKLWLGVVTWIPPVGTPVCKLWLGVVTWIPPVGTPVCKLWLGVVDGIPPEVATPVVSDTAGTVFELMP